MEMLKHWKEKHASALKLLENSMKKTQSVKSWKEEERLERLKEKNPRAYSLLMALRGLVGETVEDSG
jgi:hypothetical protein